MLRVAGWWLSSFVECCCLRLAWFSATWPVRSSDKHAWLTIICLAFAILGLYCLLSSVRSKIILFTDRIEVVELTRKIVMRRSEVLGWRSVPSSPPSFVLVSREPGLRSVKFAQVFPLDDQFAEWLYTLPSLDQGDRRSSKAEIRNNPHLGSTPGERMRTLSQGRKLGRVLLAMAVLACLWGFLYPRPYDLSILTVAVLPWIALAVVRGSKGLFRLDTSRNDAHPNVAIPFIFPGMILLLRSTDFNIIPSMTIAWASAGIGILLCSAAIAADSTLRTKPGSFVAILAFSLVYSYGAAVEANVLLDHSSEASYTARVQDRRIVSGKTTAYKVQLEPWGPKAKTNDIRVSRATYDYIRRGDIVNLVLRRGAFGISWYDMLSWQQDGAHGNGPLP